MADKEISCSGVILAGGLSSRFSGENKAFIRVGKVSILDAILSVFRSIFKDILLVAGDPVEYLDWDLNIVTDIFPIRSSLTGLHAGLSFAATPYAFVTACDTPFFKKKVIEHIVASIEPNADIIIPKTSKGFEPLCAVYSKKCLNPIEKNIIDHKVKIHQIFKHVRVKEVPEDKLRENDPELSSFFNINTPKDLALAKSIFYKKGF